jgi:endonuclease/exonuclease/phosphatase family metal-dependent hydrolase
MTTLRVMTYNMLHAPGDRLAPLVDVVKGVSPDVLACQEVNTYDGMMALSRELNMMPIWGMANSAEDYRSGQPVFEHLVVFTRFPPRSVRVHPGDRRAMFRPVLEVRLQPPGAPEIAAFVVHLRALIDPRERFLKFRELGSLLAILGEAMGPVIAMGDFNAIAPADAEGTSEPRLGTGPPEDHVAAVRGGVIGAIEDAGFVDSYRALNPRALNPRALNPRALNPRALNPRALNPGALNPNGGKDESTLLAGEGRRVDYIFVGPSLTSFVSSCYILDNEAVHLASDHRPVVAEFTFGANDALQGSHDGAATRETEQYASE